MGSHGGPGTIALMAALGEGAAAKVVGSHGGTSRARSIAKAGKMAICRTMYG